VSHRSIVHGLGVKRAEGSCLLHKTDLAALLAALENIGLHMVRSFHCMACAFLQGPAVNSPPRCFSRATEYFRTGVRIPSHKLGMGNKGGNTFCAGLPALRTGIVSQIAA
jgi:hypothetical protein